MEIAGEIEEFQDKNGKVNIINVKQKRIVTYNPGLAEKKKIEIQKLIEKAKVLSVSQAKKEECRARLCENENI